MIFLSIIIPTYNDEKYLDECIGSCLAQDISHDEYEIICVDDGSTDRTPQMLDDYATRYPNITVIHKEHGVGYGRNIGLEHAKGEYVWFVDHDDMIEENCLGCFRNIIRETKCERLLFYYYQFANELTDDERTRKQENKLQANGSLLINSVVWTSVVSRAFLFKHDIWPHSKRLGTRPVSYGVDAFFVREITEANIKTELLGDKPYYYYRKYLGQSINDYSEKAIKNRLDSYLGFALMFKEEYERDLQYHGTDLFQTAQNYVVAVRGCAQNLLQQNRKFRRLGKTMMCKHGIFPLKLPKVYTDTYSCWDCVRAKNGMGTLRSLAFYYSVNPVGLFFYGLLDVHTWLQKMRNNSTAVRRGILYVLKIKNKGRKQ